MTQADPVQDQTFSFRPARARRPQSWSFRGDRLTGPGGTVALPHVQRVTLVQVRRGATRLIRFDLETAGQVARVQIAGSARRRHADPDQEEFLALLATLAGRLAELRPGLTYRMEETSRARLLFFGIGLVALVLGVALTVLLVLAVAHDPQPFLWVLPLLLALKLSGALTMCRFWPARRPGEFPIASLPFVLWTMGGPRPAELPGDEAARAVPRAMARMR